VTNVVLVFNRLHAVIAKTIVMRINKMKNEIRDYFLETYGDGWKKVYVINNLILCIALTNFKLDLEKRNMFVSGKYNFKYSIDFCFRFGVGMLIKINSDNQIKFGNDNGNSGGIFRYGKYLDNGIWIRTWKFRKLWLQWKLQPGYLDFGLFCICYSN
jgi:hypothetical protein